MAPWCAVDEDEWWCVGLAKSCPPDSIFVSFGFVDESLIEEMSGRHRGNARPEGYLDLCLATTAKLRAGEKASMEQATDTRMQETNNLPVLRYRRYPRTYQGNHGLDPSMTSPLYLFRDLALCSSGVSRRVCHTW